MGGSHQVKGPPQTARPWSSMAWGSAQDSQLVQSAVHGQSLEWWAADRRSAGRILLPLTRMFKEKPGRVCPLLHTGVAPVEPLTLDMFKGQCLDISGYKCFWCLQQWSSGILLTELPLGFPFAWTLCSPKHNMSSSLFYWVLIFSLHWTSNHVISGYSLAYVLITKFSFFPSSFLVD